VDSPANRIQRVLIGVTASFTLMTALAVSEGLIKILDCDKNICIEQNNYVLIFPLITLISAFLLIIMHYSKEKEHEDAFLDKWISRENEEDMRIRLRKEQEEASGDSMGSGWSKMEKKHLEKNLDEEEGPSENLTL
jgi:hypothetical protein